MSSYTVHVASKATLSLYSHPWERMVEAAFRKYPNPHSPNVHTLDTIERRVMATGGLYSHRIFGTMWNVPTIVLNVCFNIQFIVCILMHYLYCGVS